MIISNSSAFGGLYYIGKGPEVLYIPNRHTNTSSRSSSRDLDVEENGA